MSGCDLSLWRPRWREDLWRVLWREVCKYNIAAHTYTTTHTLHNTTTHIHLYRMLLSVKRKAAENYVEKIMTKILTALFFQIPVYLVKYLPFD